MPINCVPSSLGPLAKYVGTAMASEDVRRWMRTSPEYVRFQDENGDPMLYEWTGKNFVLADDNSNPENLYFIRSSDAHPLNSEALKALRPVYEDRELNDFNRAAVMYEYNDAYVNQQLRNLFPDYKNPDVVLFNKAKSRLTKSLTDLAEKMGVKFRVDPSLNVKAAADLMNKVIYFQSQEPNYEDLVEEVSHFFIDLLKSKNPVMYESLRKTAVSSPVYEQVKQTYGDVYVKEEEFEAEAMGKIFADIVVHRTHTSWRESFFRWLASKFKEWAYAIKMFFQGYKDYISLAYRFDSFVDENETYVPSELKLFSMEQNVKSLQKKNFEKVKNAFLRKKIVRPYYAVTSLLRDKPSKRDVLVNKTLEELWKNKTLVEEGENEYISIDEDDPLTEIKKQLGISVHKFVEIMVEDFPYAKEKGGYTPLNFERYFDLYLNEHGAIAEKKSLRQLRASLFMLYEQMSVLLKDADEVIPEFPVYFNSGGNDVYGRVDLIIRKGSTIELVDFKTSFNHQISESSLEKAQKQLSLYKSIVIDQIYEQKIPFTEMSVGSIKVFNFIMKLNVKAKGQELTRKIYRPDGTFKEVLNLTAMESWMATAELLPDGSFKSMTDPSTPSIAKIVLPYDIPFAHKQIPGALEQKDYSYVPKSLIKDKLENTLKMQKILLERIINSSFQDNPSETVVFNLKKIRVESFLDVLRGISGDEELEAYFSTEKGKYMPEDILRLLGQEIDDFNDFLIDQKIYDYDKNQGMYSLSRKDYTKMPKSFFHRFYYYSEMYYMYSDLLSFFNEFYGKSKSELEKLSILEISLFEMHSKTSKLSDIISAQFVYKGFDETKREDVKIPVPENMSQDDLDNLFFTPDGFLSRQGLLFTSVLHSKNKVESFLGRFLIEADVVTKSNTSEAFKYIDKLALAVDNYDVFYQYNEKGHLTGNVTSPETYEFLETANRMVQEPGEETAKFAKESVFFVLGDFYQYGKNYDHVVVDGQRVDSFEDVKNTKAYRDQQDYFVGKKLYDQEAFEEKMKEGFANVRLFLETRKTMVENLVNLYGGKELQTHIDLWDQAVNPFVVHKKFLDGKPVRGNSALQFTVVMNKNEAYVDPRYFEMKAKFEQNVSYKKLWQFYKASVDRYRQLSETGGVQTYSFLQKTMLPETEASISEWIERFVFSRGSTPEIKFWSLIKERWKRFLQSFVYTRLGLIDESTILNSGKMLVRPIPAYMLKENFGSGRKSYDLSKVLKKMHSEINHLEGLQHLDSLLSVIVSSYYRFVDNKFAGQESKSFHVRYGKMTDFLGKRIYKTPERVQFSKEDLAERKTTIQAGSRNIRLVRDMRGAMYKKLAYLTSLSVIGYSINIGMANFMSAVRNYLLIAAMGREIKMKALLASLADVMTKGMVRRYLKYGYKIATGLKPSLQDLEAVEKMKRKAFKYVNLLDQLGFDFSGTADFSGHNVKGTTRGKIQVLSKALEFATSPFSIMRGTELMAAVAGLQSVLRSLEYEIPVKEVDVEGEPDLKSFMLSQFGKKIKKFKTQREEDFVYHVFDKGRVEIDLSQGKARYYKTMSFYDRLYVDEDTGLSFFTARDGRKLKLKLTEDGKVLNVKPEDKDDFDAILEDMKAVAVAFTGLTSRVQGEFLVSTPIYGKNYIPIKAFLQFKVWLISELRNRFSPGFFDSTLLISRVDPKTGKRYIQKGGYRKGYYYALLGQLKRKISKARTSEELLDDYSNYKAAVVTDLMMMSFLTGTLQLIGLAMASAFAEDDDADGIWAKIARGLTRVLEDDYLDLEKDRLKYEKLMEAENMIAVRTDNYVNNMFLTFLHNSVLQQGREATSFTSAITSLGDEGDLYRLIIPASVSYTLDASTTLAEALVVDAFNVYDDKKKKNEYVYYSPIENYFAYAIPRVKTKKRVTEDESLRHYEKDFNPTLRIREDMLRVTPVLSSLRSTRRMLTRKNETAVQRWLRKNRNKTEKTTEKK